MSKFTIVRGASGTGKSTRFGVMFDDLSSKHKHETLYHRYTTKSGTEKIGITGEYFPEINTLVIIRKLKDGSYDSLDGLQCNSKKFEHTSDILRNHNDKNVMAEGNAVCDTFRFDPWFTTASGMVKSKGNVEDYGLGFSEHTSIFFLYEEFEEARNRILGRGGKDISDKGMDSPVWQHNLKNTNRCLQFDYSKGDLFKFKFDDDMDSVVKAIKGEVDMEEVKESNLMSPIEVSGIFCESLKRVNHERFVRLAKKTKVEREIQVAVDDYVESVLGLFSDFEGTHNGVQRIDLIIEDTPIEIKQHYSLDAPSLSAKSASYTKKGLIGDMKKMSLSRGGYAVTVYVNFSKMDDFKVSAYETKIKRYNKRGITMDGLKFQLEQDWIEGKVGGVIPDFIEHLDLSESLSFTIVTVKCK